MKCIHINVCIVLYLIYTNFYIGCRNMEEMMNMINKEHDPQILVFCNIHHICKQYLIVEIIMKIIKIIKINFDIPLKINCN